MTHLVLFCSVRVYSVGIMVKSVSLRWFVPLGTLAIAMGTAQTNCQCKLTRFKTFKAMAPSGLNSKSQLHNTVLSIKHFIQSKQDFVTFTSWFQYFNLLLLKKKTTKKQRHIIVQVSIIPTVIKIKEYSRLYHFTKKQILFLFRSILQMCL